MLISLSSAAGLAQNRSKIIQLTPTIHGSTGLFNIYLGDTVRQGEFSLGFHASKFNREPGDLDFTLFPVSLTLGLHDRVELWASYEVHKRVHAGEIQVGKVQPGGPVVPARLATGVLAFYNDAPFMDVGFGDGAGDLWAGVKFNLSSERRGAPLSFALQPKARFHLTDDREHLLRGLTTGATDWGWDAIASKDLPAGATLAGNFGLMFAQDRLNVDRQHWMNYGVGIDAPLGTPAVHLIGELIGRTFFGTRETSTLTNPVSPLDGYVGLRFFPARSVAVGAAYNFNFRTIDEATYGISATDRHGFFAQLVFQRKVDRPPIITCHAERTTINQGEQVRVWVDVFDPDTDFVTITWRATGGARLIQVDERTVTFDATGLAPGTYTVTAEVTDGINVAVCSVDITVERVVPPAPTIVCEPAVVNVEVTQSVTLQARATSENPPLTYSWTVNGQAVPVNQPTFEFGTVGREPGTYRVQATVTDQDGQTATCEFTVNVTERPNRPPTVTLRLDRTEVLAGEPVTATADAQDPDNDPLTYRWTVNGVARPETGTQIVINTTGMIGQQSVTVTVDDGRGGVASDTRTFTVREERIVIQVDRRLDNIAKARLDEVAVRLQQDPRLRIIITGHTDSTGTPEQNQTMGMRRAEWARDYLVEEHGIAPGRIEVRSAGETQPIATNETAEGRRLNRRIEIEFVVQ